MRKLLLIFLGIVLVAPVGIMAQEQSDADFGIWAGLGVTKDLGKHWSVGLDAELRTEDYTTKVDRWSISPSVDYKINKYVKLGLGYEFLHNYRSWSCENHYDKYGAWNGYNVKPSIFIPRHRVLFEVTGSYKWFKWLKVSLRERYQCTFEGARCDDQLKYRYVPNEDMTEYIPDPEKEFPEYKASESEATHSLRSRLKFSIDKKKLKWSPYISVELHNNLGERFHIDKIRTCIGTDYSINKHHGISFGVLWNHICESKKNMIALTAGYEFKF